MSIEQIERIIDQLPVEDFEKLSAWMEQRRLRRDRQYSNAATGVQVLRDHGAFLNGYAPEDEGIYDDAAGG